MFEQLKAQNKDFELHHITSDAFKLYGTIISTIDCTPLLDALLKTEIPSEGNIYIPSDKDLEALPIHAIFQQEIYGGLPIQIGYCNGNSYQLNGLEYHKYPELNVSSDDIVLFLGKTSEITDEIFLTENVKAFYLPKGTLIELDGTTLHFAPCKTSEAGFRTVVVLPKGTNEDFAVGTPKPLLSKSLFKVNKWLLAHPESERLMGLGAYAGLRGKNFELKQGK